MRLPKRCKVKRDANRHAIFIVPAEKVGTAVSPEITVEWSRSPRQVVGGVSVVAEHMTIIQKDKGAVVLTPGQVYDLIEALNRAVEDL